MLCCAGGAPVLNEKRGPHLLGEDQRSRSAGKRLSISIVMTPEALSCSAVAVIWLPASGKTPQRRRQYLIARKSPQTYMYIPNHERLMDEPSVEVT